MLGFGSLWIPVVASTVAVFVASAIIWMALPLHAKDYSKLPDEDGVGEALRKSGAGAGQYFIPHMADKKDCKNPEFLAKFEKGPVAMIVLKKPGPMTMGPQLAQWFAFNFVVSFVVAYLARHSVQAGAPCIEVFRFVSIAVFLVHGLGRVTESIWVGRPWSATLVGMIDALVYSLVTGGIFCWLWPAA